MNRKPYPSDVSDDEWAFIAPYLTFMSEDTPQRTHSLREVFNGLRQFSHARVDTTAAMTMPIFRLFTSSINRALPDAQESATAIYQNA